MIKRFATMAVLAAVACFSANAQERHHQREEAPKLKVSIMGDSYSTFKDYIPEGYDYFYAETPEYDRGNDVLRVYDCWWYQLCDRHKGLVLEKNNSWSGSTVCTTGYNGKDYTNNAFVGRVDLLGDPDIILVFGGTNDAWAGAPLGEDVYENWTKEDLAKVRPAFCYLFAKLKEKYPKARIYNIINTELNMNYTRAYMEVARHYDVKNIRLHHIDKQINHPSISGMRQVSDQVWDVISHDFDLRKFNNR